ncbi:MAG: HIT family protein [Puniceicoccales bacterium]|jgi:diadenosine tetraphosphate (Ap4A) HIT family hydrolase|nr:HIT family protein [Puniceicoccales bacterium]
MFQCVDVLKKKDFIIDLFLCRVLLEDNRYYPWLLLVPMRENVKNMTHLTMEERLQLMKEIAVGENVMNHLFAPDQINTAAIGNLTPQLHVHIVARKIGDPDWPGTVWNNHRAHYEPTEKIALIEKLRSALAKEAMIL